MFRCCLISFQHCSFIAVMYGFILTFLIIIWWFPSCTFRVHSIFRFNYVQLSAERSPSFIYLIIELFDVKNDVFVKMLLQTWNLMDSFVNKPLHYCFEFTGVVIFSSKAQVTILILHTLSFHFYELIIWNTTIYLVSLQ